ncbi:Haem-NO-binding [Draconibacterium orientale]|uniref:Haem-NO-binding n=1 Tax=Draconibacterium orientale TaxID=1168034 RepID=X5E3Q9_9BACT|nr:heme NO-binding domain-containing protein [Draconibacterium orientale]AHW61231.1 heme transporter CcmB [Draconibacterium orientale]SET95104.1 Haem-NO-binding [Draconibacterium orientale]
MKGLVFREFLEMVEKEYGYETVDTIIEKSKVPSEGIYTSVGTYHHSEMFALITELSKLTKLNTDKLLFAFGAYVFDVFVKAYPVFFENKTSSFQLLADVEGTIHVEVLKLYPEAELPTFSIEEQREDKMVMIYRSQRKMADFAEGLIQGCAKHFNENITISREYIEEDGTVVLFRITK